MNAVLVVLILALCESVFSFTLVPSPYTIVSSKGKSAISMGGGRNQQELGLSKRQMFQTLKKKLITESQVPGFFDIENEKVEIELFCKGNSDGAQIGDCPFAQFVQLVLLKKGIRYNVKPLTATSKPAWITENHQGKLPLLLHKDVAVTDSLAIAEYIEKSFPHSSLTRQGAFSYQEVLEKSQGLFPALKACIINKDVALDAELMAVVDTQLDTLDEIIRSTPGQFICGIEMTLADLYILPQLFHAFVAIDHFKGIEIYHVDGEPKRPALENYFGRMLNMEEFNNKKCYVNADQIINGWKIARGDKI